MSLPAFNMSWKCDWSTLNNDAVEFFFYKYLDLEGGPDRQLSLTP